MTRRSFLRGCGSTAAGSLLAAALDSEPAKAGCEVPPARDKTIGIQVGAVSFVDEGVEEVLDILHERGRVNTIYLTTFTYGRGLAGPQVPGQPFPDHGVQSPDEAFFHGGNYARPHPQYYRDTILKETRAPDHGDLDIVDKVLPAAKKLSFTHISLLTEVLTIINLAASFNNYIHLLNLSTESNENTIIV